MAMPLKMLKNYQSMLGKKTSPQTINKIVKAIAQYPELINKLNDKEIMSKSEALEGLKVDKENGFMGSKGKRDQDWNEKHYTEAIKDVKKSPYKYFISSYNKKPIVSKPNFNNSFDYDLVFYYSPVKAMTLIDVLANIKYEETEMTDKECAHIILEALQGPTDDDFTDNLQANLKPYYSLAEYQLHRDFHNHVKSSKAQKALAEFNNFCQSLFSDDDSKHKIYVDGLSNVFYPLAQIIARGLGITIQQNQI